MRNITLIVALFLCATCWAYAQRTIQGTVKDESGEPLIGATIFVKGTSTGTTADIEGKYSLTIPEGTTIVVFSYTGFESQEIEVGTDNVIDVVLVEGISSLSEVVIVGYGEQIKSELTGNIVKVKGEQIENVPVPSVEMALQGKTAGVVVEGLNGKPGQATRIRIRGASSITASNQPLVVVDGVPLSANNASGDGDSPPLNPLADINPNDIASIDILKDASAAAIYGSRAANGVIIITTKSGAVGKPKVNLTFQAGFSGPSGRREWLNAEEYVEILMEGARNANIVDGADPETGFWTGFVEGRLDRYSGPSEWRNNETDTDWEDLVFRNDAFFLSTDVNVSGGTKLLKYYASLAYTEQEGIMVGNSFDRYSGRINLNGNSEDNKLQYGITLGVSRNQNDRVSNDNSFATPLQLIAQAPVSPVRNTTGQVFQDLSGDLIQPGQLFDRPTTVYYNGLIHLEDASRISTIIRTLGNIYASYEFFKGFRLRAEFGLDNSDFRQDEFFGRRTITAESENGVGFNRSARVFNYNTKLFGNYNTSIGNHNLDVILGTEYQRSQTNAAEVQGEQFPVDDLKTIASAADIVAGTTTETNFSFLSYFSRVNYNFSSKYLVSLSTRIDGSSRFSDDNRYGFFPAVGLGWVISEENFLGDNSFLSFLKLRGSWGLTGNAEIGNFGSLGLFGGEGYNGIGGLQPTQIANPDLKWERTSQVDIGIDFGIFNNRINGEIDYYVKNTSDLLLNVPVPGTSGFGFQLQNVGEVQNRGFEFVVNAAILNGDFKWDASINGAFNTNEVKSLAEGQVIIDNGGINVVEVGEPLGYFRGREYAGVDPANGDALFVLNTRDENGNIIDRGTTNNPAEAEFVKIGNPTPDFVGGMTNSFSYKGIELSFTIQVALGQQVNNSAGRFQFHGDWFDNSDRRILDRWQQPGDITDVPRVVFFYGNGGGTRNSRYVEDAGYLKMRDISLGYRFQKPLLDKIGLSSARVFVSARNLFTITQYEGWDPEVTTDLSTTTTGVSNTAIGNDFYSAPMPRSFTMGINLGF